MLLWWKRTWSRMLAAMRPAEHEEEFRAELEAHLQMMVEQRLARGMPRHEALRDAKMRLGGVAQLEEAHREWRGLPWLGQVASDMRFALRSFRMHPRFAISAVATTAVAIGAATAVFSVVDRSLFRPLPYAFGDRLVSIGIHAPVIAAQDWIFAGTFQEWQPALAGFEATTAWIDVGNCDRNDGSPERVGCALIDHRFLPTLGVTPVVGRNFTSGEDAPGGDAVALISFQFWASRFGSNAGIIDRHVTINGTPTRIVGVLPASFETPSLSSAQFLLPLQLRRGSQKLRVVQMIGRVRSGLSVSAARESLLPRFQRFVDSAPADFRQAVPMQLRVVNLRDRQTQAYRTGLLMLLGAVLSFVLMACANVGSLLLARSEVRRHEFAVRASLGASPGRLARQTLAESAALALAGGAAGCLIAYGLLGMFRTLAPDGALRIRESALDSGVLVFTLALSLIAALVFGLAPVIERLRGENLAAPHVAGPRNQRLRSALVSLQFAISVILLTAAGLFVMSLYRLQQTPLGFTPEYVLSASFILPEQRYASEERQIAFFNSLEQRLNEIPGVIFSAITDSLPPGGDPRSVPFVALIGGGNADAEGTRGLVKWRYVTPGYFRTLEIPIRRGRAFAEQDRTGSTPVIISEGLARRIFGDQNPVGKDLRKGEQIVGVAADVRNAGLQSPSDLEFYALRGTSPDAHSGNQRPPFGWRQAIAVIRSRNNTQSAAALQKAVQESEPAAAVVVRTLTSEVSQYSAQPRFQTVLLSLFAFIGLTLASVGLYGLTSFIVATRTREVGVRIALGATRANIVALMMKGGLTWTLAGILAGSVASLGVMRSLRALLFEVEPLDFRVIAATVLLLATASVAGTWIPSARASRIEPLQALRQE